MHGSVWILVVGLVACGTPKSDSGDADGDGFVDDDCDPGNGAINPAATDVVGDGIDQNCDGVDGLDLDGDGVAGESSGGDDCDDADADVFPVEVYPDADLDGWGAEGVPETVCAANLAGYAEQTGDCDDTNPNVHPGQEENPYDGLDTDCDPSTQDDPGDAAPTITSVTCASGGLVDFGSGPGPTLQFTIAVTDPDGDLHVATLSINLDDTIDGTVDTLDRPYSPVAVVNDSDDPVEEIEPVLTVTIPGDYPAFETTYEWSIVVLDSADHASEPYIFVCRTPDEEGNGGG